MIRDARAVHRTPESVARAGYDGNQGSTAHAAVDTFGHPLALRVTPLGGQERGQVALLAAAVPEATGETVEGVAVDQGWTGAAPAAGAAALSIRSEVIEVADARRGFGRLPRRWVVGRGVPGSRVRRLARDDERLPGTVAGLHSIAFACPMPHRVRTVAVQRP